MSELYQTIIVGGGISGLTIAHKLKLQAPGHRFALLEKSNRTGGAIQTLHDQGYIMEQGPHGFLDNCPESDQLLAEAGLIEERVLAPLIDFVRYVFVNDRLNLIPQTPKKILMAPLIPWRAKLRVLADLGKPYLEGEPTVAKWIDYRFGPALLPYIDAVFTGTYAGDPDRLTIDSVMPGIRALEKQHGSVIRGLIQRVRSQKALGSGQKFQMPAMTSFPEGMKRLPEKLTARLVPGHDLIYRSEALSIGRQHDLWQVITRDGIFESRNLILALPVNSCLKLLAPLSPDLPKTSVPEAWIASVTLGFPSIVSLPPGFGFLTPESERRFCLGTLFSSNMFANRAPEGHIACETLIGGRRHPERLQCDDETLVREAFADLRYILGIGHKPVYSKVVRMGSGIPQLERDYPALLRWREAFTARAEGLAVCGFGWDGIGVNDMIKHASRIASALLTTGRPAASVPAIKGIYF